MIELLRVRIWGDPPDAHRGLGVRERRAQWMPPVTGQISSFERDGHAFLMASFPDWAFPAGIAGLDATGGAASPLSPAFWNQLPKAMSLLFDTSRRAQEAKMQAIIVGGSIAVRTSGPVS